ncbi:hypothetical protein M514_00821 [Trichuris suis]|uniref:Uncharacterized protein n=1 Tax=Trichuris suis TaxID=68888 RepID=A0A085N088_9BILA|nr:hypothetical protein M513_00821 [Trichuris suis]KFD62884.1 hypothetical protein M514_00821 [Trichuris suis]
MCDKLLADAGVTCPDTMFRKVLAKLPPNCFRTVRHLFTQTPLPRDCYDQLTRCLRERFSLTPAESLCNGENDQEKPPHDGSHGCVGSDGVPAVSFTCSVAHASLLGLQIAMRTVGS